jgi:hypothetical protein
MGLATAFNMLTACMVCALAMGTMSSVLHCFVPGFILHLLQHLQIKTIWSVLLRNFEFQLVDPLPDADYNSMVIGPKPCKVKFTRRKLVA